MNPDPRSKRPETGRGVAWGVVVGLLMLWGCWGDFSEPAAADEISAIPAGQSDRGYSYRHDEVPAIPWSIHIFKLSRSHREFTFQTTLGSSNRLGMSTVSEQMLQLDPERGQPIAAVNGDFYTTDAHAPGDPRDLQIFQGELVSAPAGHACFWVDPSGQPQMTNVQSRLRFVLYDGVHHEIGLNELRPDDKAVLYTPRMGATPRTGRGVEYVLEPLGRDAGLPLRPETVVSTRVRSVCKTGDSPVPEDGWILSIGPTLAARLKPLVPGAVVQIQARTFPSLAGVQTAIGGGPTLVRNGKPMEWSGILMRHPRTAIGWNKDSFFLVEVDGRQGGLSVGMTFPELADYMVKLGCEQAMNLDGGGSATLWVRGNVMNSPSEGHERPGANSLVILQPRVRHARSR
jgi:hypothetical protein